MLTTLPEGLSLPAMVDRWTTIGRATGRANRAVAEAFMAQSYRAANLDPPTVIVWADSPAAGAWLAAEALTDVNTPATTLAERWARGQYNRPKTVPSETWNVIYGQHEAAWLAHYDTLREACKLSEEWAREVSGALVPLEGLTGLAKEVGWCWVLSDMAIMTERPAELHLDSQGRMHNARGKSILYADGYGFCCWHGLVVPDWIVETPDLITLEKIDAETNSEIQRVMLEIYGWDRYMEVQGAELLDENRDLLVALYRMRLPGGDGRTQLLLAMENATPNPDGTRKRYIGALDNALRPLPGPWASGYGEPQELTALNAVASTFGLRGEEYVLAAAS